MAGRSTTPVERMRLDKWLWAARFFKTRSLASQAVDAGHVRINGDPVRPARLIGGGETVAITAHGSTRSVVVRGLNLQRRPAAEAQLLYEETAESVSRREAEQQARRLAPSPGSDLRGRPTKKARRKIHEFGSKP